MNKKIILLLIIALLAATGCSLYESVLPQISLEGPSVMLSTTPERVEAYFAVTDSSGNLFVATNEGYSVKAFDSSGDDLWSAAVGSYIIDMRALSDSELIVSTYNGIYCIIDKQDGTKTSIDDSDTNFVFYPAGADGNGGFYYIKKQDSQDNFLLMHLESGSSAPALITNDFDDVIDSLIISDDLSMYHALESSLDAEAPVVTADGSVYVFLVDNENNAVFDTLFKRKDGTTSYLHSEYTVYSFSMTGDKLMLHSDLTDENYHHYDAVQLLNTDGTLFKEIKTSEIGPELAYTQDNTQYDFHSWKLSEEPVIQSGSCYLALEYSNPSQSDAGAVFLLNADGTYEQELQLLFKPRFLTAYGDGFCFLDGDTNFYQTDENGEIVAFAGEDQLNPVGSRYTYLFGLMPDGQGGVYLLGWDDSESALLFLGMEAGVTE